MLLKIRKRSSKKGGAPRRALNPTLYNLGASMITYVILGGARYNIYNNIYTKTLF